MLSFLQVLSLQLRVHFILSPMRDTFTAHLILFWFHPPNNICCSVKFVHLFAVQLSQSTWLYSPSYVHVFPSSSSRTRSVWKTRFRFQTVPVKLCFFIIRFWITLFLMYVAQVSTFPNIKLCIPKAHCPVTNYPRLNTVLIHITPHSHTLFPWYPF